MERVSVRGTISSAGFADGNRFVVGCWAESPLGPMADVMWGTPDGARVLLAPSAEIAEFVTAIYDFDEVRIGPLDVQLRRSAYHRRRTRHRTRSGRRTAPSDSRTPASRGDPLDRRSHRPGLDGRRDLRHEPAWGNRVVSDPRAGDGWHRARDASTAATSDRSGRSNRRCTSDSPSRHRAHRSCRST